MFGTNPRYKKGFVEAPYLVVNSVFMTIQGEGPWAGYPAIFVRLSHCNLACTFCDTEFEKGEKMMANDLMNKVNAVIEASGMTPKIMVITGGEPLLQNLHDFCQMWKRWHPNKPIQIETAGTVWDNNLNDLCLWGDVEIVCSPKTSHLHPDIRENINAWKYIVKEGWVSDDDGLPEVPTQPGLTKRAKLARPHVANALIYVQPVDEQDKEQNEKNVQFAAQIAMKHGYVLSLQLHKLLGLE